MSIMRLKTLYIIVAAAIIASLFLVSLSFWKYKPHKLSFKKASFSALPGWAATDTRKSLLAFQISCKAFLKQEPDKSVGSDYLDLKVKDWYPACNAAMSLNADSIETTRAFFQTWFTPVEFFDKEPVHGLFTGYYMPLLHGSLTKTDEFNVPLYGVPSNMITVNLGIFDESLKNRTLVGRVKGHELLPFYSRKEINQGAISDVASVIAWVDSRIDRSFLEIQGSGIIQMADGSQLAVGYAAQNGAHYTAIAKVLIDKGVMTRDNASMQHIRTYLEAHPKQIDAVLNQNKSFVFFSTLRQKEALGSQGVPLTPGYSLAIDRQWVPFGMPVWLDTTRPGKTSDNQKLFQRLMIAQDTGGAIKGVVRGDVYWGAGDRATTIAGRMKNPGHYWLFIPRESLSRFEDKLV